MSAFGLAAGPANLKSRFLTGLDPSEIKVVLHAAKQKDFSANSVVVEQGDAADDLFLIAKGRARFVFNTIDGRKIILFWLTPGAIFGGAAVLSLPSTYLVSTETVRNSSMLVWDRSTLRDLVLRYPRLLDNASLISYDYLAWYISDHLALISHTARQRLAAVLVHLARILGEKVADGFEFDVTNDELAAAANVTRFTASRALSEWQASRAIAKRRGKILLRSPKLLYPRDLR
jgi:CRP-like cAMP-binding protein